MVATMTMTMREGSENNEFLREKKTPLRPLVHSLGVNETFPTVGEEERDRLLGRGNIIGGGEMVITIIMDHIGHQHHGMR